MEEPTGIFRLTGPNIEQDELTISREGLTVGRVSGNDLILVHKQVSRRHVRIVWQSRQFWVEDLGSRNGTMLRERRLQPHQAEPLNPGDTISVGPYTLTFVGAQRPPEPRPSRAPEESLLRSVPPPPRPPSKAPEESRLGETPPPAPPPIARGEPQDDRYPVGVPRDKSSWLQYLPAIYANHPFIGRYLLIFEAMLASIIWMLDNFDMYLAPKTTPAEWLRWMASWFDLLVLPELPVERLRAIMGEVGWLFLRRGTRSGLERLLTLYFDAEPEIIESPDRPHFTVRLPLAGDQVAQTRVVAERLIESQKPAFAGYTLEIA